MEVMECDKASPEMIVVQNDTKAVKAAKEAKNDHYDIPIRTKGAKNDHYDIPSRPPKPTVPPRAPRGAMSLRKYGSTLYGSTTALL